MTVAASSGTGPAVDRRGAERDEPGLVARLREDTATRVLLVHADAVPLDEQGRLVFARPGALSAEDPVAFLGRDGAGTALLAATSDDPPAGSRWEPLRRVAAELAPEDSAWAVEAVSIGRWLDGTRFCSFCGTALELEQAGWSRRCPHCGRQHFPRTDPAVIVAVTDRSGERLLLGANAAWPQGRFSCFAGFAEAGESLEDAVVREVEEESGVAVEAISYRGSQPWPYPRSLMLGFRAVASDAAAARADGVEIAEVRWFTRAQIVEALDGRGEIGLPGPSSIAHALISGWAEETP